MAPVERPIPRFIGSFSGERLPYGRWEERLREAFLAACAEIEGLPEGAGSPEEVRWFPERGLGERRYVPASAHVEAGEGQLEVFGHVSYLRGGDGEATDLRASAEFTDQTAERNPDWEIDLGEDVVGEWRGEGQRAGALTLVWGTPLVPGATAATAELDGEVVDQAPVVEDRFTLLAIDAVRGFGDELYLEVRLWSSRGVCLAQESLYDDSQGPDDEAPPSPDSSGG